MNHLDRVSAGGVLTGTLTVPPGEADRVVGPWQQVGPGRFWVAPLHNLVVNRGLQSIGDAAMTGLTAVRITHIALSAWSSASSASSTDIDPSSQGVSIKSVANVSRASQTIHADATWTQADVAFSVYKIGFLTANSKAALWNVIGGTTAFFVPSALTSFSLQLGIDVTFTAT